MARRELLIRVGSDCVFENDLWLGSEGEQTVEEIDDVNEQAFNTHDPHLGEFHKTLKNVIN